jgi:serine/threonine protein kinase
MVDRREQDAARAETQRSGEVPATAIAAARSISETERLLGGRYRLIRSIASGGMGTVYEGEHVLLGHRVAIKMLHPQYAQSESSTKRFMNESRAAARLRHPNVARCDDVGVTPDGHPFLVLEFLTGRDLADELEAVGPFPLARALGVTRDVASALGYAHSQGVVHRDLKPENIFLARGPGRQSQGPAAAQSSAPDPGEQVKVLDFGVARFIGLEHTSGTRTGAAIGTPLYMAPEQFTDASRVDARADIYGLGVMLYEMLTNQRPYDAGTLPDLLARMSKNAFRPLPALRNDVPEHVVRLVHASLSADPNDRPESMEAFVAIMDGELTAPAPLMSRIVPGTSRISDEIPVRANKQRVWLFVALGMLLGLGAWLGLKYFAHEGEPVAPATMTHPAPPPPALAAPIEPPATSAPTAMPEPAVPAPTALEAKPALTPAPSDKVDGKTEKPHHHGKKAPKDRAIAEEPDF